LSYLVLARKSRPKTFEEVVGQTAVVRTLQNALSQNRVPHALIFSGVRGVGKTTLARIMAKALNCERGPTSTPCNQCRSCREIMSGSSIDLHEIDGASNRGIQEIRELKENIRFMPTGSRFKIIIIDEVHMLTTEAFNALLKTLEEPPEHVYFMFATTELHRVPVTILSRCQRYELKRIGSRELTDHFRSLAESENIDIEPAALNLIVREAAGSVRDGLSLLDQIFSYCGSSVSADDVVEVLGLVSGQVIADLASALLAGDLATAMDRLDQVYTYGMDLKRFINELLSWFRNLVVCRVGSRPEQLLDLPEDEMALLRKTAESHSAETLSFMFNVLMESLEKASFSSRPRFALEMAFIRAVQVPEVVPVMDILSRFDEALAGVHVGIEKGRVRNASDAPEQTASSTGSFMMPEDRPVESTSRTQDVVREKQTVSPPAPKGSVTDDSSSSRTSVDLVSDNPVTVVEKNNDVPGDFKKDVRQHWNDFVAYVKDRKPWMAVALQRMTGVHFEDDMLIIQYDNTVDCSLLKNKKHITPLTEYAMDFFQGNFKVRFQVPDSNGCAVDSEAGMVPRKARRALANDPLVLAAVDIFDGKVGAVRVGPRFRKPVSEAVESGED